MTFDFKKYGIEVSRETTEKLEKYHELLLKWQKAINLVSNNTLEDAFTRHFLDSVQLINYIENKDIKLVDMGSGAGFPGLVLAILGVREVHLVESDSRKCQFLKNVSRETGLTNVTVHNKRIEDCEIDSADLFSARALASLDKLFSMVFTIKGENNQKSCLFLKGEKLEQEIADSLKEYSFEYDIYPSISDEKGKIIKISQLSCK